MIVSVRSLPLGAQQLRGDRVSCTQAMETWLETAEQVLGSLAHTSLSALAEPTPVQADVTARIERYIGAVERYKALAATRPDLAAYWTPELWEQAREHAAAMKEWTSAMHPAFAMKDAEQHFAARQQRQSSEMKVRCWLWLEKRLAQLGRGAAVMEKS